MNKKKIIQMKVGTIRYIIHRHLHRGRGVSPNTATALRPLTSAVMILCVGNKINITLSAVQKIKRMMIVRPGTSRLLHQNFERVFSKIEFDTPTGPACAVRRCRFGASHLNSIYWSSDGAVKSPIRCQFGRSPSQLRTAERSAVGHWCFAAR